MALDALSNWLVAYVGALPATENVSGLVSELSEVIVTGSNVVSVSGSLVKLASLVG